MQNINAPQNANATQSNGSARAGEAGGQIGDRAALEREVLDAIASFSPRDRNMLRNWHRHAISLVHVNVLTSLDIDGPLSMTRLAETMDVSDASATGIVDRMEKRGLVERRRDASDRRVVLVCPTERGLQVFRDMDAHRRKFLGLVLSHLSDAQLAALKSGMQAVLEARRAVLANMADAPPGAAPETPAASSSES
jgi:DNA-binding MarR family transcriptional regulator